MRWNSSFAHNDDEHQLTFLPDTVAHVGGDLGGRGSGVVQQLSGGRGRSRQVDGPSGGQRAVRRVATAVGRGRGLAGRDGGARTAGL